MRAVSLGPVVIGLTLILLSLHPLVIQGLSWLIPINERSERPVFAAAILVIAGLAFVVYGVWNRPRAT